jgi:hypothetical protein
MKPGSAQILDNDRAYITPGNTVTEEGINVSGGGYLVLYRGDMSELLEERLFFKCVKDAISKIVSHGSNEAVQVANTWINHLYCRTNKNKC